MSYTSCNAEWHKDGEVMFVVSDGVKQRLPRYYKDKFFMFSEVKKERLRAEGTAEQDINYWKEIDRLSKFHKNPMYYYDERIRSEHEAITTKANSKDKF